MVVKQSVCEPERESSRYNMSPGRRLDFCLRFAWLWFLVWWLSAAVIFTLFKDYPIIVGRNEPQSSEILPASIITEVMHPNNPIFYFGNGSKPSIECSNKFNTLGMWPDTTYNWIQAPTGTSEGVLFGSFYAQESIWKQQHPTDCSDVKF